MLEAGNYLAFRWASREGHMDVIKQLKEWCTEENDVGGLLFNYWAFGCA
jgi:hypothetical protein